MAALIGYFRIGLPNQVQQGRKKRTHMVLFFVDMILKALDGLAVADSLSQRDFVGVFEARANRDAVCHLADFDTTWL